MAKAKAAGNPPAARGVPNKHLHARVAFLHQAATYLALQQKEREPPTSSQNSPDSAPSLITHGVPLLLANHLKAVSMKAQIRLSRDMKRSICKICDIPLVSGKTSETRIQNLSRGAKKPWADVLVVRCLNCQTEKRFPVGAQRQEKKSTRKAALEKTLDQTDGTNK